MKSLSKQADPELEVPADPVAVVGVVSGSPPSRVASTPAPTPAAVKTAAVVTAATLWAETTWATLPASVGGEPLPGVAGVAAIPA